jgi:small subunit ribosomal protein S4
MTKRHQAKYKIDRRMGQNIWGRPKSPINKREYGPGQHGQRRKGKLSDYGVQLRAKQKLKGYYANMSERHFHGLYDEARRLRGDTGANMIGLLERRLDTVIYRAKFVPTVFAARQFISHGHIKVNGKRVTVASYRVKVGEEVEVKEKSKQLALVLEANGLGERDVLQDDREAFACARPRRRALPRRDGAASRRRVLLALILTHLSPAPSRAIYR